MAEKALVIVCTYNERDNIVPLIDGIFSLVPAVHVLVVDDASPDGTGSVVQELAREDTRVQIMRSCQ